MQLGLRTLSVGLANNLLLNLPEPFKRSTFAAAAASAPSSAAPAQPDGQMDAITATPAPTRAAQGRNKGPVVPAGSVVAPWSVVALATLLHR
jgi:DMSO/TMAO reductase YedYZ molybdopterin-dependent catalytic subunit